MGKEGENGSHVLKHEQTTSAIQHKLHLKHLVGLVCCRHHHLMPKVTSGSWSKTREPNSSDTDKCNVTNFVFVYHHSTAFTQKPVWDGNTWGLLWERLFCWQRGGGENESVCLCLSEEPGLYWNVRSHIVTNFPRGMQCVNTSHLADARRANWQRIPSVKTHTLLSGLRLIACRIPYDEQLICTESNAAPAEGRKHRTEEREDGNKD